MLEKVRKGKEKPNKEYRAKPTTIDVDLCVTKKGEIDFEKIIRNTYVPVNIA